MLSVIALCNNSDDHSDGTQSPDVEMMDSDAASSRRQGDDGVSTQEEEDDADVDMDTGEEDGGDDTGSTRQEDDNDTAEEKEEEEEEEEEDWSDHNRWYCNICKVTVRNKQRQTIRDDVVLRCQCVLCLVTLLGRRRTALLRSLSARFPHELVGFI